MLEQDDMKKSMSSRIKVTRKALKRGPSFFPTCCDTIKKSFRVSGTCEC